MAAPTARGASCRAGRAAAPAATAAAAAEDRRTAAAALRRAATPTARGRHCGRRPPAGAAAGVRAGAGLPWHPIPLGVEVREGQGGEGEEVGGEWKRSG